MESIDQTVTEDISAHVTMLQDVDILDNVLQDIFIANCSEYYPNHY